MNLFRRSVVNAHLPPRIVRAGVVCVALSIGLVCSLLFRLFFGSGTFLLFFGAVAVIAAYSGLRFGLLSVFISLALLNFFDFPPFDSLAVTPDAIARVGIFVFVASLIGWLSEARRASEREREEVLAREQRARHELSIVLERERALQQRTALLAELGVAMTRSLDPTMTLQQLARTVVPALADCCIVYVQQPHGMIERVVVVHRDPAIEALLHEIQGRDSIDPQSRNPVAKVLRTGTPNIALALSVEDAKAHTSSAEQRRATEALRPQAHIVLPLIARDRTLGAITFAMGESGRPYTEDDVALAQEVAQRAALAMDNAQLYQQAQNAVQVRDQFLSIAAHELKTPLTTLTGQIQLVRRRTERDGEGSESTRRSLRMIDDQVRRLNTMVRALLDVSRIEHGQLRIERTPVDICALVRRVVSEVQATVEDREIIIDCPETPLYMLGDAMRLDQVLLNLVQNALTYSAASAPTTVTVREDGQQRCIAVQDRGIGIPAADLQQDALRGAGCERIFTDSVSGAKTERLGLTAALDACRAGDILVVWKLDRLGRSLAHLVATVEDLAGRSVGFRSLQEQLDTTARSVRLSASLGTPTLHTPARERVLVFLDVTL